MNYTLTASKREKRFFHAYIEAIYFTDTGDTDQPDTDCKLDEEFLRESLIDCLAFLNANICYLSDNQLEQAGHDFWFTRNGHGTGFWDRNDCYKDYLAKRFTDWSKRFGEVVPVFDLLTDMVESVQFD